MPVTFIVVVLPSFLLFFSVFFAILLSPVGVASHSNRTDGGCRLTADSPILGLINSGEFVTAEFHCCGLSEFLALLQRFLCHCAFSFLNLLPLE
jgi:hypothetical protein